MENFGSDEAGARLARAEAELQVDFLGAQLLEPSPAKPGWRLQAFFSAHGVELDALLPDGSRFVLILDSQYRMFGIGGDA
jgi:hypothetical protein